MATWAANGFGSYCALCGGPCRLGMAQRADYVLAAQVAPDNAAYERARREQLEREQRRLQDVEAQERDRQARADRARETLLALLDDKQRKQLARNRWFGVVGSAGGRYRIWVTTYSQNIHEVDRWGRKRATLCAYPYMGAFTSSRLAPDEAIIGQLLTLRFNEPGFLRVANRWPVVGRGRRCSCGCGGRA